MIAPQDRDEGGLGWLFQLVAVFVFFVLPVVRSVVESRKRSAKGAGGAKPPRPKVEKDGRELWREMLEGRRPEPTPRPARPTAQAARPKARPAPPLAPAPQPSPARAADAPMPAPVRPLAEQAPPPAPLAGSARLAPRLPTKVPALASSELDPATLDDEMAERWGGMSAAATISAGPRRSPAAAELLGDLDWRRAVLLSEVLAPPLALRGPAAAWPGPPASLTQ